MGSKARACAQMAIPRGWKAPCSTMDLEPVSVAYGVDGTKCCAQLRLHTLDDRRLVSALRNQGLVLGHQVPVWCVP